MHEPDRAAELQVLSEQFIDGFVQAADKMAYLRLAGVPLEKPGTDGGPSLKLVDVKLTTEWQVGSAAPSFGSRELSYLPYPGEMIDGRTNMELVYVSLTEKHQQDGHDIDQRGQLGTKRPCVALAGALAASGEFARARGIIEPLLVMSRAFGSPLAASQERLLQAVEQQQPPPFQVDLGLPPFGATPVDPAMVFKGYPDPHPY